MSTSTFERIIEAAAEARAAGVRAATDRPSHRRCAEEPGSPAGARGTLLVHEVRAGSGDSADSVAFHGFASVYNRGYEMWDMFGPYTEQVVTGAGAASLARDDLDVPFVLQHDPLRRIARTTTGTLTLAEATEDVPPDPEPVEGLMVDAPALDMRDADVSYIVPKLDSGLIDEMSFRFRINAGAWSPDWTEYHIEEYDIHRGDVSIVGYGANPHTQGAGLRSLSLDDLSDAELREVERSLLRLRKQRGLDPATAGGMSFAELDRIHRSVLTSPADVLHATR